MEMSVLYHQLNKTAYCTCRARVQINKQDYEMVQCDSCNEWYHCWCLGINVNDTSNDAEWICEFCTNIDDFM